MEKLRRFNKFSTSRVVYDGNGVRRGKITYIVLFFNIVI